MAPINICQECFIEFMCAQAFVSENLAPGADCHVLKHHYNTRHFSCRSRVYGLGLESVCIRTTITLAY